MSQQQQILAALRSGDWVCSEWMYRNALPNGRNRIGELRRAGYGIESELCPDAHGPGYFRYRLRREPIPARLLESA